MSAHDEAHGPPDEARAAGDASGDETAWVDELLARATAADDILWADLPNGLEAAIVETIAAAAADDVEHETPDDGAVVRLDRARRRPSTVTWWLSAAAALAVIVTGAVLIGRGGADGTVFALAGTDAAPEASAEVRVADTPAGLKITITCHRLPGAPEGTYYEAWLSDGQTRVSAGTFHLRSGSGPIELWSGVADRRFDQLAITLEPVDGDNASSGNAYLRGTIAIDG